MSRWPGVAGAAVLGAIAAVTVAGPMTPAVASQHARSSVGPAVAEHAAVAQGGAATRPAAGARTPWLVGFAKESVDPRPCPPPDPSLPCDLNQNFHLGGFGLGPTRVARGPLVDPDGTVEHIYARAMAISNRQGQTLLLAAVENQGMFAAYKQGPYGLYDIRQQVSQDTGVPIDSIVINTDHSHAGPDLIGLWGGVPVSYLQLVRAQTIRALDEAFAHRVAATLLVGTATPVMPDPTAGGYVQGTATPGEYFDHSQFGANIGPVTTAQQNGIPVPNPPAGLPTGGTGYRDDLVDTQLRVLQAYDLQRHPLGTLINYAAHGTVMGSGNLNYSADWPGGVAHATERALGEPVAVTMVADVGRTQPPRPNSDSHCDSPGHPSCDSDKLATWTRLFTPWVVRTARSAVPVRGHEISSREVFTRETGTNPALLGVSYSGEVPARGFGAYRSSIPPWLNGNVVGTFVSAHRVGDILLTANPGEAYPDIRFGVLNGLSSLQASFTFGLANDQLGYLIAPASEYPWITYSQPGNDNSFFNISVHYGDHDYCTQIATSQEIGFMPAPNSPNAYGPGAVQPLCALLTASDALPMGPAPQQPWPFGDGASTSSP